MAGQFGENTKQQRWDLRYMALARVVGQWSKDPSTKVGSILIRPNNSIASTGYNGFPPGHDDSPDLYNNRAYKYKHTIHAEINALTFFGQAAEGFCIYTSFPTCPDCMRALGKAGVTRVVSPPINVEGRNLEWIDDWKTRIMEAHVVAREYGIELKVVYG